MYQLVLTLHVLISIAIIGLVLIQQSKSSDMGGAFGSGASGTVFGSQGSGGFLFKLTGGLMIAFFLTSLALSSMLTAHTKINPELLKSQRKTSIPIPSEKPQKS
jgi:preprotein translocase subunit SecG